MRLDGNLTFGSLQLWRLFLCPLMPEYFFFDVAFVMPIYLCYFSYSREYSTGTIATWLRFNFLSKFFSLLLQTNQSILSDKSIHFVRMFTYEFCIDVGIQLVSYAFCLLASLAVSESSGADLLSQDSAFFSIFVAEWFMMMLKNPNKPTDLVFCTLAQKYFILIVLVIVHFVASYDWISIAAVIFVGTSLHLILNHRGVEVLNPLTALIEKALTCGRSCNCSAMGFVTAEQGRQHAQ